MPGFTFRAGEDLTIWVKDRTNLPAFHAIQSLQRSLAQIGVASSLRGLGGLPDYSIAITRGAHPVAPPPFESESADAFRIGVHAGEGITLSASEKRGLSFSIWELLERLGWIWPTPTVERSPKGSSLEIDEGVQTHTPALSRRIVFLEEVQVTPEMLVWFSRQRLNTLFPSNPLRFSDPESQFSDLSMTSARELGFDFIIGGEWWDWLAGDLPEGADAAAIADRVLPLWEEMGTPPPRLSLWPEAERPGLHARVMEELHSRNEAIEFETSFMTGEVSGVPGQMILHRVPRGGFESTDALESSTSVNGDSSDRREIYLALEDFCADRALGCSVSPFLWPRMTADIRAAIRAGFIGASLEFRSLPLERFLEGAGFAAALAARGMWHGLNWSEDSVARGLYSAQFDTAGAVVARLVDDFAEWTRPSSGAKEQNGGVSGPIAFASSREVLISERRRDQLDERISEIEESPPSEPCLELIRSLSTLVSLYDLENTADIHEAAATARMIWKKNDIDRWPDWLTRDSPLVEHLKPLLRTTPLPSEGMKPLE